MAEDWVSLELRQQVAWLTIARPKALNALNSAVLSALEGRIEELRRLSPRCLVIGGAGEKAFVAGADIAEMEQLSPDAAYAFARRGQKVFADIEELPFPVIAAVRGFALGGGLELALACDLIVASDAAQLGQPEITLGIIPGFGGTQRLARRVGHGAARWLVLTGRRISAVEALRLGLVDEVVPAAEFPARVQALAEELAARPAFALRQAKALLRAAGEVALDRGLEHEAAAFGLVFAHSDRAEGMRAFLERRAARFS